MPLYSTRRPECSFSLEGTSELAPCGKGNLTNTTNFLPFWTIYSINQQYRHGMFVKRSLKRHDFAQDLHLGLLSLLPRGLIPRSLALLAQL